MTQETKTCANCKETKPLSSFKTGKYRKDGSPYLAPTCGNCKVMRRYYRSAEYREKTNERSKRSQAKKDRGDRFAQHLRHTYGIEPTHYVQLLIEQDYRCSICDTPYMEQPRRFHVDHDHRCCSGSKACGKCVRGLLCSACNLLLGQVEKAGFSQWLLRAEEYLNHHG